MKPFSSDYYDATLQADRWWKSHMDDGLGQDVDFHCNCLKSRLRFDYLYAKQISLQRADLLDGACFQHTRPADIRQWLDPNAKGRHIQVRTISESLERDLLEWVKREGETTLNAEPFLLIPEEKDEQYQRDFPKLDRNAICSAADLASAIGEVTEDKDLGKQLSEYWQSWIDDTDCLEVKQVDRSKADYGARLVALTRLVPSLVSPDQVDDAVRIYSEATTDFLNTPDKRGNFFRRLTSELPEILPWVNNRIAAARSDADGTLHESLINVNVADPSWRKYLLRLLTNEPGLDNEQSIDVTLPDILPQWLVVCDYGELLKKIEKYRTAYLGKPNENSLKRLAEAIVKVMNADQKYEPLPEPSADVDLFARCAVFAGGGTWTAVNIYTAGWDVFGGIKPMVDAIPAIVAAGIAFSNKTKESLTSLTRFLTKQEIVDQTIHTFRRRGIVE